MRPHTVRPRYVRRPGRRVADPEGRTRDRGLMPAGARPDNPDPPFTAPVLGIGGAAAGARNDTALPPASVRPRLPHHRADQRPVPSRPPHAPPVTPRRDIRRSAASCREHAAPEAIGRTPVTHRWIRTSSGTLDRRPGVPGPPFTAPWDSAAQPPRRRGHTAPPVASAPADSPSPHEPNARRHLSPPSPRRHLPCGMPKRGLAPAEADPVARPSLTGHHPGYSAARPPCLRDADGLGTTCPHGRADRSPVTPRLPEHRRAPGSDRAADRSPAPRPSPCRRPPNAIRDVPRARPRAVRMIAKPALAHGAPGPRRRSRRAGARRARRRWPRHDPPHLRRAGRCPTAPSVPPSYRRSRQDGRPAIRGRALRPPPRAPHPADTPLHDPHPPSTRPGTPA